MAAQDCWHPQLYFQIAATIKKEEKDETAPADKPFTISILQTTDVHCLVHPHDELFWENDKAVFRQTGGYAHLATYLQEEKTKDPDTPWKPSCIMYLQKMHPKGLAAGQ